MSAAVGEGAIQLVQVCSLFAVVLGAAQIAVSTSAHLYIRNTIGGSWWAGVGIFLWGAFGLFGRVKASVAIGWIVR